ncbi:MAG TPA: alpha-amylase family glycosyl hydrolase [Opitutaceae bacterium]|nr:alpha-amylase family glycosyl hydrolase [Opitutaceae bacterium]
MTKPRESHIAVALLDSPNSGVIELTRDWKGLQRPPLSLSGRAPALALMTRESDYVFGCDSGYFVNKKGEIFFFLLISDYPSIDWEKNTLYLAGDFNGWQVAVGRPEWQLHPAMLAGNAVLLWSGAAEKFFGSPPMRFKFVTGEHVWLDVPAEAPNAQRDDSGNLNRIIIPEKTGRHLFRFTTVEPVDLSEAISVIWSADGYDEKVPLRPERFFYEIATDLPLGAITSPASTAFRIFIPRAKRVKLFYCSDLTKRDQAIGVSLERKKNGVWETQVGQNLHGWFYWYSVDGPHHIFSNFDKNQAVLDPYALATVDRDGPGIILDRAWLGSADRAFKTPDWQDLIISEVHVRDLVAQAPLRLTPPERSGFTGLRKWVDSPDFYLKRLGINCVELQPVQEFDNVTPEEYHWGYMTNSFFGPESSYSLDPKNASGVKELQELVAAFHRQGIAVLLDVVYNHVGVPAHLLFLDKLYYFEVGADGVLANWSGCGNDLRARSAMSKRLIIDSLIHLIEVYGVDGFRFDLADLLGVDVLKEIETAIKKIKPDVILIAEPWSFRGHIAGALRPTGWASWNDGYRNFVREFVRGGGSREGYEYFLKGSPWHFAYWPAQTVNYTESHDDKTWIDTITENGDGNGFSPTMNDRRRTHLMAAILMMSVGIPMLAEGQDFLRSKRGVNNTYQRGDLNALDYRRMLRFPSTHAYFADWIAFRKSARGKILRLFSRPNDTFFQFFFAPDSNATATIYNADKSQGSLRLLFSVNPTLNDASIALGDAAHARWRQVCDHERFFFPGGYEPTLLVDDDLFVPALGCALWVSEDTH